MPKATKILKGLTLAAGVVETVNTILNNDSTKKVAEETKKTGEKIVKKVKRIDDEGTKIFKYNKKKLSQLYAREKISEEVYDYLVNELKYSCLFSLDNKTFEKRFKNIIKAKNKEELSKAIRKYEKIRDKMS